MNSSYDILLKGMFVLFTTLNQPGDQQDTILLSSYIIKKHFKIISLQV